MMTQTGVERPMTVNTLRLHQLNDVKLVGRLTRDPELKFTGKGQAVCRIDLAVNRRYKDTMGTWKDDTSFIPVVVWREAAQRCSDFLKKGSPVYVDGRLKSRTWETKEGQKRTSIEVNALRIQFLAKMNDVSSEPVEGGSSAHGEGSEEPVGAESPVEEEIPF